MSSAARTKAISRSSGDQLGLPQGAEAISLTGVNFVVMINAATIVEVIFVWPGLGSLLLEAVGERDFPLVQGIVIMSGTLIIITNFLIDLIYAWVDPRIRLTR